MHAKIQELIRSSLGKVRVIGGISLLGMMMGLFMDKVSISTLEMLYWLFV